MGRVGSVFQSYSTYIQFVLNVLDQMSWGQFTSVSIRDPATMTAVLINGSRNIVTICKADVKTKIVSFYEYEGAYYKFRFV